jgi:predicted transcriptional regulator
MKKTSVYLSESEEAMLKRLAERTGKSRSCVLREAIAAYDNALCQPREFASVGAWDAPGFSVADMSRRELLEGFGE